MLKTPLLTTHLLLLSCALLTGCGQSTSHSGTATVDEYKKLIDLLLTSADVGIDEEYQASFSPYIKGTIDPAPKLMRNTFTTWDKTGSPNVRINYRYDQKLKRIILVWEGSQSLKEFDFDTTHLKLKKQLASYGLNQTLTPELSHIKEEYDRRKDSWKRIPPRKEEPRIFCFQQRAGNVLEEVLAWSDPLTGGSYRGRNNLIWAVSVKTDFAPPTFGQLPQICDYFEKPVVSAHDASLWEFVNRQPVLITKPKPIKSFPEGKYSGFRVAVPADAREDYEAELKKLGFEMRIPVRRDYPKFIDYEWHRFADGASGIVSDYKEKPIVYLSYNPRDKDPSQAAQPVILEEVNFATEADRELYRAFFDEAKQLVKPDWTQTGLVGGKLSCLFRARTLGWYEYIDRVKEDATGRHPDKKIHLLRLTAGRAFATSKSQTPEELNLAARWASEAEIEGWSAGFSLSCNLRTDQYPWSGRFQFHHYGKGEEYPIKSYPVNTRYLEYRSVEKFEGVQYQIIIVLQRPTLKVEELIASPQAFKAVLIDQLSNFNEFIRKEVEEDRSVHSARKISSLEIQHIEKGQVFASLLKEPIRKKMPEPQSDRKLTEKEKVQIIQKATASLNAKKQFINENYEEMYAALLKSFPLDKVFQKLEKP